MSMAASKLPNDCLFEIFSRLPAKQICKFRAVNKSFRAFLSEPHFVKQHAACAVAYSGIIVEAQRESYFQFFDSSSGVPDNSVEFLRHVSKFVVASEGGLICFVTNKHLADSGDLCIFNPVTGAYDLIFFPWAIQAEEKQQIATGVSISLDDEVHYQLFLVTTTMEVDGQSGWELSLDIHHYTSGDKSWEFLATINAGRRNTYIGIEDPVAAGGWIYWASVPDFVEGPYILGFDTKKNRSKIISLPQEVTACNHHGYEINVTSWADESVCLIQYTASTAKFSVWVMKPSEQGPWTKISDVNLASLGLEIFYSPKDIENFTVTNGNLLVFSTRQQIYAYNLREKKLSQRRKDKQLWYPVLWSYANVLSPWGQSQQFQLKNLKFGGEGSD